MQRHGMFGVLVVSNQSQTSGCVAQFHKSNWISCVFVNLNKSRYNPNLLCIIKKASESLGKTALH